MNRAKGMLDALETHHCTIVEEWLAQLEQALAKVDSKSLNVLFLSQSYWRDVLALTWTIQTLCGAEAISNAISELSKDVGLSNIQVELADIPPRPIVWHAFARMKGDRLIRLVMLAHTLGELHE